MTNSNPDANQIHEVFPYLRTRDAGAAIDFYQQAFGAVEDFRLTEPGGRIGHAELKFGAATIMVSDEYPEYGIHAPAESALTGSAIHLHVQDVDAMTQQAVQAGATLIMEPADQFYGERAAKIRDPFGHEWLLGSEIEKVTPAEMQRRFNAMFEEGDQEC
ncbi:VOC family protein [Gimesia maris]|uniref:VOC family protein n=1 Tax=Gimesia maris TaxID=122 RepID=UPI00242013E7|nr:VOC family protein [Gimesia maris]|tara:strand:- start:66993 stop:67472 length:480 start_codon:yes stop_codon:yes gene_type:complete